MKKCIGVLLIVFLISGCSFLPRFTFDKPGVTPQKEEYAKVCHTKRNGLNFFGIVQLGKLVTVCQTEKNKEERKFTLAERIANFVRNFFGWFIVICVILVFVAPGLLISLLGGIMGRQKRALVRVVGAVQKARKNGKSLNDALDAELDNEDKVLIRRLKEKEGIK